MTRRARGRVALWLGATVLAAGAWPLLAGAHAVLVRATPPARASLADAPDRVELTFSERLEPAFSTVSVHDAAGQQVDRGQPRVAPDDVRRLSVTLPRLPPGAYTVRYRVLSVDGHVVDAHFTFTVRGRARD